MICKECAVEGKTSKVFAPSGGICALIAYSVYYDESGKRHDHDPNATAYDYHCSNGHAWVKTVTGSCWCGWPNKKEKDDG